MNGFGRERHRIKKTKQIRDGTTEGAKRMITERDMKLNTAEIAPNPIINTVKASFCAWLSSTQSKPIDISSAVSVLDTASEQLQKRKIASLSIWEITKPSVFADVYSKARDNKFFRIMDKKNYLAFMRDGQLYLKFLKTKPMFQANIVAAEVQSSDGQPSANFTIKEAVLKVLTDKSHPMAADEIYGEIIKQGLYTFGAKNPVNVVRNIIESACDNSGYSEKYRVAVPCFHFEKNSDGKRVYSLLEKESDEAPEQQCPITEEIQTPYRRGLTIWDYKVEQEFQKWLERENYAQKTADNYRRATAQIFCNYVVLAQKVVETSEDELEAVRKYIALLNEDKGFVEANATRHNQFTAALAALERFYSSDIEIINGEEDIQKANQPETKSLLSSSLGNIVDLEEGKAGIREILDAHFQTLYGYSNISILWKAAQDNLSLFLNDNAINTADELWRFVYRVFFGEYVMSNPHIWKTQPNYPQSYVGVIVNLARQSGGTVTREQIDEYFVRIKQGAPINATIIRQGLLMFYEPKQFIFTEAVSLTNERCVAITNSLDKLYQRENVSYVVLRDIDTEWFSSLPTIDGGLNWTALLLQEVLRLRPAIGYRIIFSGLNGQALDTLGAAIVPSKSEITIAFPKKAGSA